MPRLLLASVVASFMSISSFLDSRSCKHHATLATGRGRCYF